jgi:hypothetical protein
VTKNLDNTPDRMWHYWENKYGIREALQYHYPNTLADDPQLQVALAQIKNAELAIKTIMGERARKDQL